jgi:hypothetical protein
MMKPVRFSLAVAPSETIYGVEVETFQIIEFG